MMIRIVRGKWVAVAGAGAAALAIGGMLSFATDERPGLDYALLAVGAGPDQTAELSDGNVSDSEYVAAYQRTVACIRAHGISVTDPVWKAGQLHYTAGPFDTREALLAAKPLTEACYETHLRGVAVARAVTN